MTALTAADLELESVEMLPNRETLHSWRRPGNSFSYTNSSQSASANGGNNNPAVVVSPAVNVGLFGWGDSSATGGSGYGGGNGGIAVNHR